MNKCRLCKHFSIGYEHIWICDIDYSKIDRNADTSKCENFCTYSRFDDS